MKRETAVTLVVALLVVSVGVLAGVVAYNRSTIATVLAQNRTLAEQNHGLASQALGATRAIQGERTDQALVDCRQQNHRHRLTTRKLDQIIHRAEAAAPPLRRAQIRESQASTVLLIDTLAPLQDCEAVVKHATSPAKHAPVKP